MSIRLLRSAVLAAAPLLMVTALAIANGGPVNGGGSAGPDNSDDGVGTLPGMGTSAEGRGQGHGSDGMIDSPLSVTLTGSVDDLVAAVVDSWGRGHLSTEVLAGGVATMHMVGEITVELDPAYLASGAIRSSVWLSPCLSGGVGSLEWNHHITPVSLIGGTHLDVRLPQLVGSGALEVDDVDLEVRGLERAVRRALRAVHGLDGPARPRQLGLRPRRSPPLAFRRTPGPGAVAFRIEVEEMPTVLAIDAGTTGVTSLLFDEELRPLARAYREFPQSFPRPGWVEHDAATILAAVDATAGEVLARPEADDVVALGITNQRETVFALEAGSARALAPGIVWQDRRTAARCRELQERGESARVRARTGLVLDPYFSATKIEWLLANHDGLLASARAGDVRFATVDALIVAHLTGGARCATDPTNASRTMLFDIEGRAWSEELGELFGVDVAWLPEVRPSVSDFGVARADVLGRELPITGIAGDQQAALFGQGCVDPGSFKNTYGTGCFLLLNTGAERVTSERGLLTTLAVGRDGGPCYALEGSVFVGGAVVQWLRDGLGLFESAAESERLAREVEDTGGVHLVPAFTGLGAPYWDADARGALLGLTRGTTRAHVARAALEAIAFQNAELVELLREESGLPIDRLLADGGATRNDLLMQLQADLAGLDVVRPSEVEATARGAAALAAAGAGSPAPHGGRRAPGRRRSAQRSTKGSAGSASPVGARRSDAC